MKIAVDAMGGDHGPSVTVPAAIQALLQHENLHLILVGDRDAMLAELKQHSIDPARYTLQHTTQKVEMDEPPAAALRGKKDSSMRVAINLVKENLASACVSAGNTGALMATARFVLKTLPGIDRPAIIAAFPTLIEKKSVRMLDLGANVDSSAEDLLQFALMGSVLASAVGSIENPKVYLLNIGSEDIKGNEQVKAAAQLFQQHPHLNYQGFIEGNEIYDGVADVVVCDGFVGNVSLKVTEGVAKLIKNLTKKAFLQHVFTKIVGLLAKPVFNNLAKRIDPDRYNGACFIGLQGIVIKSHGGANQKAFTSAIVEAMRQAETNIPERIRQELASLLS